MAPPKKMASVAILALLILIGILVPASASSVQYTNYFVSATGNGDCNETSPCTLRSAFAQVQPVLFQVDLPSSM